MEHTNGSSQLSTVQQCVVNALAMGATLTGAAAASGVHRVTIYRWIKTHKQFAAALRIARAEFVLASRDKLFHLSDRSLDTLLAVLDNPKASPAVQLRAAMFILQRPQMPKVGWSMPEPVPNPHGNKLLDSAIVEQDYSSLPCLHDIERDVEPDDSGETPTQAGQSDVESAAPEPSPPAESPLPTAAAVVSACNRMQHDLQICDDVVSTPVENSPFRRSKIPPPHPLPGVYRKGGSIQQKANP